MVADVLAVHPFGKHVDNGAASRTFQTGHNDQNGDAPFETLALGIEKTQAQGWRLLLKFLIAVFAPEGGGFKHGRTPWQGMRRALP